jgi:hypothetical protein
VSIIFFNSFVKSSGLLYLLCVPSGIMIYSDFLDTLNIKELGENNSHTF